MNCLGMQHVVCKFTGNQFAFSPEEGKKMNVALNIFKECVLKKIFYFKIDLITDKMKEAMVAKIAHQCSELFSDAMKLMQLASLKDLWPKVSSIGEMNKD